MKTIKRINPDLVTVTLAHMCDGTDGPVGTAIIQQFQLNEYELRNLQLEVAKGEWPHYHISYSAMWEGEIVRGEMSQTGALSRHIDILAISNDMTIELFKLNRSK
jgi:hypothetical protein